MWHSVVCQTWKEMQVTSGNSSPDTSCSLIGPGFEKICRFEKYPDKPQGKRHVFFFF